MDPLPWIKKPHSSWPQNAIKNGRFTSIDLNCIPRGYLCLTGGGTTSLCVANTTEAQIIKIITKMIAVKRYPIASFPPAQGRNHWDDDNSDPRDRDVGQGDSHGGQLRALICILSQDTGHCAVWDIHSGIA